MRYLEQGKRRPSCSMVAELTGALDLTNQEAVALTAIAAHSPYRPSCGNPAHLPTHGRVVAQVVG